MSSTVFGFCALVWVVTRGLALGFSADLMGVMVRMALREGPLLRVTFAVTEQGREASIFN